MKLWIVLLLVIAWEETDANPTSVSLTPGEVYSLKSPNYPIEANSLFPVTWFVNAPAGYKIQVYCPDLRLGSSTEKNCQSRLIFREVRTFCETRPKGSDFVVERNSMIVDLILGMMKTAAVRCELKAIPLEAQPDPTPVPPSANYFSQESWEIDSSEFGGPQGKKSTSCPCGWSNKASKRIVLGKEAEINEYPFMVAIYEKLVMRQFCGGSIITNRHILTACHCTEKRVQEKKKMLVMVGGHNTMKTRDQDVQLIDVQQVFQHAECDTNILINDIAILVLEKEIIFSRTVGPVCVSPVQYNLDKKYVRVIGWGRTSHSGPGSNVLKEVDVRVVPLDKCHERYSMVRVAAKAQICVYGNDKASCMGDSGGPVVWVDPETNRYTIVGLVSFGRICAGHDPGVNTDVSAYYDWIQDRIRESTSMDEKTCHKVA